MKVRAALYGGVVLLSPLAWAGETAQLPSGRVAPVLALHLDFYVVDGAEVSDGSGNGYTARLVAGEIVAGRKKPAVKFSGSGDLTIAGMPPVLDPSGRALTVGAMCKPTAQDGVIVSMGDANEGFSLYLQEGVPQFAVRANGALHTVAAREAVNLDQWIHLAGVIGPKGELSILLNTSVVGTSQGSVLAHTPTEPFSVGADPGATVGAYSGPSHWQGLVQDVRLYWGALSRENDREVLGDWADRPGCGCKK